MLRLRSCVLAHLLSSPATYPAKYPVSSLHRLLSAAAAAVSPNPSFAVEEYLVDTCGLTRAQALKASTKLSHLKSSTKPDAVLAFLAGLGLSSADVAAVVAKDPRFLCARVEKTLAPNVAGIAGLGLSSSEVARLVSLIPAGFRCRSIVSTLPYYLSLMGSYENLLPVLKRSYELNLFSSDLERVVKPNVALMRECGLGDRDIRKLCLSRPGFLSTRPERLHAMVACAKGLGVPCASGMFRHALEALACISEERIAAKVEHLKKTLRWSDAEVVIAVSKTPSVVKNSEESLKRKSEFFFLEAGLEPPYIAHNPVMLRLSLEGRLRPRYYAVKFLKENGLLKRDQSYATVFKLTEKAFMEKIICPHKEAAPHLAEDYATACREGSNLHEPRSYQSWYR